MTQERSLPGRSHYETYAATASVGLLLNAVLKRMPECRTCFYGRVRLAIKPRRASSHKHLIVSHEVLTCFIRGVEGPAGS
jgi:hypothetical protein